MSNILASIDGRRCGLDHNGRLLSVDGFVSGEHGSQILLPSTSSVSFFDDFIGDLVQDEWGFVEGTDSATSAAAILAGGIGGVLRLTTGDAGTGYAADAEQMNMALQWQASNGGLFIEARLKLSAITTCYAFIGFTDTLALEAPIVSASSANTLTTNATDAVGFMFDTNMTADTWWLTGVANDVDATAQNTGYAPVADTYAKFRIEIDSEGAASFFYNGIQVGTKMTGAVTPAADLTPIITVSKLSVTASMNLDLDYVALGMNRV